MPETAPNEPPREVGISEVVSTFGKWCAAEPVCAALLAIVLATLFYFFGCVHIFVNGSLTAARWAWAAWNEENDLQHGPLIPLISLWLIWHHREELARASKRGSNRGLWWVALGVIFFVLAARCLQPRMALVALPFLLFGASEFLWGKKVARILLFPFAFLIFTIPFAALVQATFRMQFVITGIVGFLVNLIGIQMQSTGTALKASDGSFNFEVAEGCSGIRSLMAMTMLTAVFVHLTQDRLWKKVTIFCGSLLFAIAGNVGRIFVVILLARFWGERVGMFFHDRIAGLIFFPVAVLAMLAFSKLVNLNFKQLSTPMDKGGSSEGPRPAISYDY